MSSGDGDEASGAATSGQQQQWKVGFDPKQRQDFRRSVALRGQKSGRLKLLERIRKLEEEDKDAEEGNNNIDATKSENSQALERVLEGLELEGSSGRKRGLEEESKEGGDGNYSKYFKIEEKKKEKHQRRIIMPCQLMYSEWFIARPDDFDKWYCVVCPAGKRCLVFANSCHTRVFGRDGKVIATFKSLLPGGGVGSDRQHAITLLDCVWSKKYNTMYILDVICWNSVALEENTVEIRTFMLHSKITETPDFGRSCSDSPAFIALPKFTAGNIKETLDNFEPVFHTSIDGLLFYHHESFYVEGETPCCLWMTLDQVKSLLGFDLRPDLLALRNTPQDKKGRENKFSKAKPTEQEDEKKSTDASFSLE